MKHHRTIIPAVLLVLIFMNNYAQDWPQFLGPDRNSTSPQENLLRTWPEKGPEVLWTVDLGIGYGGPVVKDGKVYILDRNDAEGDKMRCFDLNTGEELWKFEYDAPGSVMFPGSRSVPAIDGNHVYSCGPYGDLYCFDKNTHKPVWNKNLWTDFGGDRGNDPTVEGGGQGGFTPRGNFPIWAITQCPQVYGDLLIVLSQAPEAGAVAYNKITGAIVWKTKREPDFNKGSMIYADRLILATDGMKTLYLIEPDPTVFKPLASSELLVSAETDDPMARRFGTQNWAPIALSEGNLLIRDQSRMLCVKVAIF